jgi:hydroxyethylthiazole kinase
MLGGSLATVAGAVEDPEQAALAGAVAFGLAGEAAAAGEFGPVHGPASYNVAFKDAVAGLRDVTTDPADDRIEQVVEPRA